MYPFCYRNVVSWDPSDRAQRTRALVEVGPARTYGVYPPQEADAEADFVQLCHQTPASLALYTPMAEGYELLYARPGYGCPGFLPMSVVHARAGWQVLSPAQGPTASSAASVGPVPTSEALPSISAGPARLPAETPLLGRGLRWESLFAAFLDCGVSYGELFAEARVPKAPAWFATARAAATFVQRQDLIHLHRFDNTAKTRTNEVDSAADALALQARALWLTLPSAGPLLAYHEVPKLSPLAQLGLLRTVTAAHLAVYVPDGAYDLLIKTHERYGEARGKTQDFAAAATARGWFVLPCEMAFASGAQQRAASYLDGAHLGPDRCAYASLFDAYLLGGGVCFDVPEDLADVDKRDYVRMQSDAFVWRFRANVRLHSATSASAWGKSYAVPVPVPFVEAASLAQRPMTTPVRRSASAGVAAERPDQALGAWFALGCDAGGRLNVRPSCEEHEVAYLDLEVDHHGQLPKDVATPTGSPRPPPRRLTWSGSPQAAPASPPLGAGLRPLASPQRVEDRHA